jgi:hypothetical protein
VRKPPPRRAAPRRPVTRPGSASAMTDLLKILGGVAVLGLVVAAVIFGVKAHNARANHCKGKGGHVTHTTSTHYYTDKHGTHSSSDTTYYCATDHGIIDVWG